MKNRFLSQLVKTLVLIVFPFSVVQSWAKVYATLYNISPLPNGCREVTFLFWDDNGTQ